MSNEQVQNFIIQATQSIQSGQFHQALDLINQAIALDPTNAEAHILRGIALAQTNQPDAATAAFQEAIVRDPSSAKANYNLSVHLYGLGQKQGALDASRAALNIDPNHAGARDMAARLENELGIATGVAPTTTSGVPDVFNRPPSTTETPSTPEQSPYGSSPYGQPQQNQPYYRAPYEPIPQNAHSIAFVENMGKNWDVLGYALAGLGIVIAIANLATSWNMIAQIFTNPAAAQQASANPFAFQGPATILSLLGYIPLIGSLVWMIIDLADKRGNWIWLLPYFLCCCCGFPYIPQLIYIIAGRNKG